MDAVIFDMDGVIFDSERAVYLEWVALSEKYGFADVQIPYWQVIGVNAALAKQVFLDFYGSSFPYDAYKAEQSAAYHAKYDGGKLPLKPGVKELLSALRDAGIFTAIASSTRTALVEQQIEDAGLAPFFDRIVGGDQVKRSKPEPDIFLWAGRGFAPGRCVVIEDSFNGIRAAQRAGMRPVMVPDLLEPDEEMRMRAEAVLPDLFQVRDYLGL